MRHDRRGDWLQSRAWPPSGCAPTCATFRFCAPARRCSRRFGRARDVGELSNVDLPLVRQPDQRRCAREKLRRLVSAKAAVGGVARHRLLFRPAECSCSAPRRGGRSALLESRIRLVVLLKLELPGCAVVGQFESPILGGDGNREFLLALAPAAHRVPFIGVPLGGDAPAADEGGDDGLTPMPRPTKESTAHSRASTFANEHSL